jgi:hypothetical protein
MRKPKRLIAALAGLMAAAGTMLGTAAPASAADNPFIGPIVNYGSGMCLVPVPGPDGNLGFNNLPIQQTWCDSSVPEQQWHFVLIGSTYLDGAKSGIWHVVNQQTGMCLDDRDGRTADRSPVQQYTCNDSSTTMQWVLSGTLRDNIDGFDPLINMRALQNSGAHQCLDVAGGSGEAGAALQLYHCTAGNWAQHFHHPVTLFF